MAMEGGRLEEAMMRLLIAYPKYIHSLAGRCNSPELFADSKYAIMWRAMLSLVEQAKDIDPLMIESVIINNRWMNRNAAMGLVNVLQAYEEKPDHFDTWARQLFENYVSRQLKMISQSAAQKLDAGMSPTSIRNDMLRNISELETTDMTQTFTASVSDVVNEINNYLDLGIQRDTLSIGVPEFDEILGGIEDSWYIVIGGDSGTGKSSIMMMIVDGVIRQGKSVGIVTLEMSGKDIAFRQIAWYARIDSKKLRKADLTPEERERFNKAADEIGQYAENLRILDQQSFSGIVDAQKIFNVVRAMDMQHPLDLVVVDYFQLFAHGDVNKKEDASKLINQITKQLKIPVVLLSQLNNDFKREKRAPNREDLKGTRQLKQDANVIILIDRPDMRLPKEQWAMNGIEPNVAHFIFDKVRDGAPDITLVADFRGEHYDFVFSDQSEDEYDNSGHVIDKILNI